MKKIKGIKMKTIVMILSIALLNCSVLMAQKIKIYLREEGVQQHNLADVTAISFAEDERMYVHFLAADSIGYEVATIEKIAFCEEVSVDYLVELVRHTPIRLLKNYPNPFNPVTNISFELSDSGTTAVEIFNAQGRQVKTLMYKPLQPGEYHIEWDGTDDRNKRVSSGVYFYRVLVNDSQKLNKMIMLK